MVFFILGAIDTLGGIILFFSNGGSLSTYIGIGMIVKGVASIIGDVAYFMHG